MPTEEQAVSLLQDLGLTQNEAQCFVALSRVGQSTAAEISDLSDVPRSRVYDAVDRLHRRGLVDVQQSEPREYRAVSREEAIESLRHEYESTVDALDDALGQLQHVDTLETQGAWAIADHENVTSRIASLVGEADDEVLLIVVDDTIVEDRVHEQIREAVGRGSDVLVEVGSDAVREAFEDSVPAAAIRVSDMARQSASVEGNSLGRILMVDRENVLISAIAAGALPEQAMETAIWASGADHGLVVGMRELLSDRIRAFDAAD